MTTLMLLSLRTLSAAFYVFFVFILPLVGILRIQENYRSNLIEGIVMIGVGGAFFFISLRYVKRKMVKGNPVYKEYGRSHRRAKALI